MKSILDIKLQYFWRTIREECFDIYEGLQFDDEEQKKDLSEVINKFEEFFVGETHTAYESYQFHLRKQENFENIETFISVLRQLAKNCSFGELKDRLIMDQVVVGAKDDLLRGKLKANKYFLTLYSFYSFTCFSQFDCGHAGAPPLVE
uniref:Retrotransposon gag domain-containing protein n=1 Tax=Octopus bimaculoides TaxID=37653 RepID=A0A0L8GA26_OCTBM